MSLAHVRLTKILDLADEARYLAGTPDFSCDGKWEEIGLLVINKKNFSYRFEPSEAALNVHFLPPEIYSMDEVDRHELLKGKYKNFAWGAWSMRINAWALQFLSDNFYPDIFPDIYSHGSTSQ
jgi:hypothetical protein